MSLEARLRAGALELAVDLSESQIAQLLRYLGLIVKWGKVYNLTAVRDSGDMLEQHLLDSLSIVRPLKRQTAGEPCRLLDVGSGAGLPGVVVAICRPEIRVDCVDAVAKKAAFIQQVAVELGLGNLHALHSRVQEVPGPYEVVTSRAFASLTDFTSWSAGALAPGGVWLAMKGKRPPAEIDELAPGVDVFHVEQLTVPGLAADRCIVWMRKR